MIKIEITLFIRQRAWFGWYYASAYSLKTLNHGQWKFEWTWGSQEETEDYIATPWHNCYMRSCG